MSLNNKEFIKAKDYAYRLLSYRQRSTKEIEDRLKRKKFSPAVIGKTIEHLRQLNYLNDQEFAQAWIRTKMQLKPMGLSLLRYQLREKGVAEGIIEKAISDFALQYDEGDAAKRLVGLRRSRYKDLAPVVQKRRLYAYLRRRGFSQEIILQALE